MRQILLTIAAGLLLAACASGQGGPRPIEPSQVGPTCRVTEQVGCFEIDLLAVEDGGQSILRQLIAGEKQGVDLGVPIYQAVKAGQIELHQKCAPMWVYFWRVDPRVRLDQMREYDSRIQPGPVHPTQAREVPSELGKHDAAFRVELCGGKAAFQVPWEYIKGDSFVLICSADGDQSMIYPNRSREKGVWLTAEFLQFAWRQGREFSLIPVVFRGIRPTSRPIS